MHPTSPVVFSSFHFSSSLPSLANPFLTYHPVPAQCPLTNKPTPTQRQKVTKENTHKKKVRPAKQRTHRNKRNAHLHDHTASLPLHMKNQSIRERERGVSPTCDFPTHGHLPSLTFFHPSQSFSQSNQTQSSHPSNLPLLPCPARSAHLPCLV